MSVTYGVNLAGAEFGETRPLPGTYGTDYTYPTHAEVDYYAAKGLGVVRLPFRWERLQKTQNGPLDAAELARLDDIVDYIGTKGLKVVLDPHNYAQYYNVDIGGSVVPNSAFADFWGKVAAHFHGDGHVTFGLMNEPHNQSAATWLASANAAIAAIRNVGATQEILVPGSYWTGAWTWVSSDNDTVVGPGVRDPLNNFAFEVHQYLDSDGSGRHSTVVSETIGPERLRAITGWARANNHDLFLGEIGVASDATSLRALDNTLNFLDQNADVWEGVTYWSGGPWYGNYMFSIEPASGVDKPQMDVMEKHIGAPPPPAPDTGTVEFGAGPDTLKLLISGHGYQGEPTFTLRVDGVQVGGLLTATADREEGEWQVFNVHGDWAQGQHTVAVTFTNDLYGGSAATDRNLFIGDGATYNGADVAGEAANLLSNGTKTFTVNDTSGVAVTHVGTGPDTLLLRASEDAWNGHAQFTVRVDGRQIGGTLTTDASHRTGEVHLFAIHGTWGAGNHKASISFVNDAWGGTAATDRNLYLDGAAYNGAEVPSGDVLYWFSNGAKSFSFTDLG